MHAKPWLNNKHWRTGVIRSDARKGTRQIWLFAILWNLLSLPLCFVLPGEISNGNYPALIALLFPFVGMLMLTWAWRKTKQWQHFGVTELRLDPFPGSIGGQVGGTLQINANFEKAEFKITLQSVYSHMSGSGKNGSRKEDIKWQVEGKPEVKSTPQGVQLKFCFDVPTGLHPSEDSASSYYFWRLQIRDQQQNVDVRLHRNFELPVFETAQQARYLAVNTGAATRNAMTAKLNGNATDLESLQREHGLSLDRQGDWLRLYFPTGRHKSMALAMLLVGMAFAGVGVFLGLEGEIFMSAIFCLFGLLLLSISLYVPFNSLDVRISPREIYSHRSWLGLGFRRHSLAPDAIQTLQIDQSSSTTSASGTVVRYRIRAMLRNGAKVTLSEGIVGQLAADAVREKILEAAGLPLTS